MKKIVRRLGRLLWWRDVVGYADWESGEEGLEVGELEGGSGSCEEEDGGGQQKGAHTGWYVCWFVVQYEQELVKQRSSGSHKLCPIQMPNQFRYITG